MLARIRALTDVCRSPKGLPVLDDGGLLRLGSTWVALPPLEERLLGVLLSRFGAVVAREDLMRAGWGAGDTRRNSLDVHMLRLRRRVDEVGLEIRTVRSRGYLLQQAVPASV